jgi:hypothetical protein
LTNLPILFNFFILARFSRRFLHILRLIFICCGEKTWGIATE